MDECSPTDGSCSNTALDDGSFLRSRLLREWRMRPTCIDLSLHRTGNSSMRSRQEVVHTDSRAPARQWLRPWRRSVIDNDVILDGRDNLAVDGNDDHPVFSVPVDTVGELRRFTVTGGFSAGDPSGSGGGVAQRGNAEPDEQYGLGKLHWRNRRRGHLERGNDDGIEQHRVGELRWKLLASGAFGMAER